MEDIYFLPRLPIAMHNAGEATRNLWLLPNVHLHSTLIIKNDFGGGGGIYVNSLESA